MHLNVFVIYSVALLLLNMDFQYWIYDCFIQEEQLHANKIKLHGNMALCLSVKLLNI